MSPLILIPAYGRKYNEEFALLEDWENGLDFKIEGGPMCSIRDITSMKEQFGNVSIRMKPGYYVNV